MGYSVDLDINTRHGPRVSPRPNLTHSLRQLLKHGARLGPVRVRRDRVRQRLSGHVRVSEANLLDLRARGVGTLVRKDVRLLGDNDREVEDGGRPGAEDGGEAAAGHLRDISRGKGG